MSLRPPLVAVQKQRSLSRAPFQSRSIPCRAFASSGRRQQAETIQEDVPTESIEQDDPPQAAQNETLALLERRGLFQATNSRHINDHLSTAPRTIYLGIDPTAPSLHVGNLLAILTLVWLVRAGHKGILLVGGATGSIGDPSGKSKEREDLGREVLDRNVEAITRQLEELIWRIGKLFADRNWPVAGSSSSSSDCTPVQDTPMEKAAQAGVGEAAEEAAEAVFNQGDANATTPAPGSQTAATDPRDSPPPSGLDIRILNNADFYTSLNLLDFLRDIGRHVRIGDVLARDSVKTRLAPPHGTSTSASAGLSFTEFTYQLLQAYDFYHLHRMEGCTVQIGGSDQMGNIMAGVELIRRKNAAKRIPDEVDSARTYALTIPLMLTSSGEKLGKSAGNAIFLSEDLTSDYTLYQYLLRTEDVDTLSFLLRLTFLSEETIKEIDKKPSIIHRKKDLADEVLLMVRGPEALQRAQRMTQLVHHTFVSCQSPLEVKEILESYDEEGKEELWNELKTSAQDGKGDSQASVKWFTWEAVIHRDLLQFMVLLGLAPSKTQAKNARGATYLNQAKLKMESKVLTREDLIPWGDEKRALLLMRTSKKNLRIVLVEKRVSPWEVKREKENMALSSSSSEMEEVQQEEDRGIDTIPSIPAMKNGRREE